MAIMLKNQYKRDDLHLEEKKRRAWQEVSGEILQLETEFMENLRGLIGRMCLRLGRRG